MVIVLLFSSSYIFSSSYSYSTKQSFSSSYGTKTNQLVLVLVKVQSRLSSSSYSSLVKR